MDSVLNPDLGTVMSPDWSRSTTTRGYLLLKMVYVVNTNSFMVQPDGDLLAGVR